VGWLWVWGFGFGGGGGGGWGGGGAGVFGFLSFLGGYGGGLVLVCARVVFFGVGGWRWGFFFVCADGVKEGGCMSVKGGRRRGAKNAAGWGGGGGGGGCCGAWVLAGVLGGGVGKE